MASCARAVVGLVVMLPATFVLSAGGGRVAEAGVGTGAGIATASAAASMAAASMEGNDPPILLTGRVADPHQARVVWLAATGHTLRGAFLDYWNRYGGLAQFGYPLTEEFYEPLGPPPGHEQYLVQYFERNRFELHPENAGTPYEVLLGTLGREFHQQDPPAPPLRGATYFPQTGHNLSGVFKAYWEGHGGLFVHGYPITEQFEEESPTDHKLYLVQYFERSRFEWHPQNAGSQYEVLLGLLGRQLSEKKEYASGAYPRYGHAADFRWISGQVLLRMGPGGDPAKAGCAVLEYEEGGARMQLDGTNGEYSLHEPLVQIGAWLTVHGRRAAAGEMYTQCYTLPAPGYFVYRVQQNAPNKEGSPAWRPLCLCSLASWPIPTRPTSSVVGPSM